MATMNKRIGLILLALALPCIILMLVVSGISAQQNGEQMPLPPPESKMPQDLPMQSILFGAEQLVADTKIPVAQLKNELENRGITMDEDGRVHVEIIGPPGGKSVSERVITQLDGKVTNTWRHRTEAWIPIGQLSNLARSLPPGYFMEQANTGHLDDVTGEGPIVTNSDDYRDNGADCSGLTIAVIDSGYISLTLAINNGDAPAVGSTTQINYTPSGFESTTRHGTGSTEAIFDHCPGATYRLYKTDSLADLGTAVDDAIDNNVDLITHSKSHYRTGWADDTGDACAAVARASAEGILFFTSAGNRAQQHWQGDFNNPDADVWHDWVDGDEALEIEFPANHHASFHLSWDTEGGTFNYDLYLYDATLTTVLISSTNSANTYETFGWTNNTATAQTVNLAVRRVSGGTTEMEVFMADDGRGTWQEQVHIKPENSTTSPSNCTNMGLISVGAVDWRDYSDPKGSNNIRNYSSQGPSNSGATLPHIVGPTNTKGFAYPGGFGGTSCATPNAAGTAGAFWSSNQPFFMYVVRSLLLEQARIFKDWGNTGIDDTFGSGGIVLHAYHPNTIWVDRGFENGLANSGMPYYYVADAQAAAISGGRIVFVGGSYPESVTLNKNLLYETIGSSALLGDE